MGWLSASIRELTNARALDVAVVDATGAQLGGFDSSRPATAVKSNVSVDNTVGGTELLAANAARRQFIIYNDGPGTVFASFGATTSITDYTVEIAANGVWEGVLNGYTGVISAFKNSATPAIIRVTEVTT